MIYSRISFQHFKISFDQHFPAFRWLSNLYTSKLSQFTEFHPSFGIQELHNLLLFPLRFPSFVTQAFFSPLFQILPNFFSRLSSQKLFLSYFTFFLDSFIPTKARIFIRLFSIIFFCENDASSSYFLPLVSVKINKKKNYTKNEVMVWIIDSTQLRVESITTDVVLRRWVVRQAVAHWTLSLVSTFTKKIKTRLAKKASLNRS